jgi:hypothetical protein
LQFYLASGYATIVPVLQASRMLLEIKCVERFKSGELKTNLQRALCINKAENRYQRPTIHPANKDLLDEHHAFRIWLAKQPRQKLNGGSIIRI